MSASTWLIRASRRVFWKYFRLDAVRVVVGAVDETEILDTGFHNHRLDGIDATVDEVGQRPVWCALPETGVQIGTPEIGVHDDYFLSVLREADAQTARD